MSKFDMAPLPSISQIIEGLIRHIKQQIINQINVRDSVREGTNNEMVSSYRQALNQIVIKFGLDPESKTRLTAA